MNPMEWFQQSMSLWTDPTGVARDAGRQVFGSQATMMRNLELLTKAWQMVAPKLDAKQDWRSGLTDFGTKWFEQATGMPAGVLEMSKDSGALWQSYMNEWGPLLKPWVSSAIQATGTGHLGEMMLGGSAGLSRLFTMGQDEFQPTAFTSLAEIPSIGVTREHQAKLLRAFDAFVDLRKVMLEFNQLSVGAMGKAVENVMEKLVAMSEKGEKIKSVRELNRLWLDSADEVFTKMYASEEYLGLQRKLSTTGMTYKLMQQDVIEMALKGLNLPTRRELDDAYKTLYELRKEVKALKKALRQQSSPATEGAPAGAVASTQNAIKQVPVEPVAPTTATA